MKTSQRILLAFFALILMHAVSVTCSSLSLHQETQVPGRYRNQPRRLLASVVSFSANPNKPSKAMEDPKKSVETSFRKAPPSKSNPTQNR
ncbi:PREDICTED: G-type lectin S-receptor serine/threonine-kinase RLK1 [Prunus dulcis]|uniref:PREDICTED: G-type lectin S-receptor serine/threonine-kinase RLK1 n=1 Tax=Prunus dulcis TaxID=3755 RepID=A0A5E4GLK6_PRUDU|nr:hypothetical protein L3X38_030263 [Prunus dulcis]VVA31697.1 PREDICTED: G-type lectin S-receptor serine/threonine-kinase RLK1 [Prunus dulcis]VVA40620.1 PREDICTED: G-type lectin S-receptor serine/threonine-kinase RLK1 [Prunus dulcis]